MAGFNRIILVGNLTREPDMKQLTSGQQVCRLGLATNRQFKNRQTGNMVQEVCYIDIDVWGAQAESCKQYLSKGRSVLIEGRLKLDTWEDPTGQTRSKHSVVADRVVFLTSSASTESMQDRTNSDSYAKGAVSYHNNKQINKGDLQLDPNNTVERELMEQLQQAKKTVNATTAKKEDTGARVDKKGQPGSGEISFKDNPPFEDDLPF